MIIKHVFQHKLCDGKSRPDWKLFNLKVRITSGSVRNIADTSDQQPHMKIMAKRQVISDEMPTNVLYHRE